MTAKEPSGDEREVQFVSTTAIDGAPITYIVVLAAVVVALSFVPISPVLGAGSSFPASQGVYGLLGWILGPVAGALATLIGRLIAMFIAPHTAGSIPLASLWAAAVASFAAGAMGFNEKRKWWAIPLTVIFVVEYLLYIQRAIAINGVAPGVAVAALITDLISIILFALPTRKFFARLISSDNLGHVAIGLFVGTWIAAGLMHVSAGVIYYYAFNWPEEIWITLIPLTPFENLLRSLIGAVIGTGVVAGFRAIGLVKPSEAIY
jgi:hypothetical protein